MPPHFAVMPVNRQLSAPATGFEQPTSVILEGARLGPGGRGPWG